MLIRRRGRMRSSKREKAKDSMATSKLEKRVPQNGSKTPGAGEVKGSVEIQSGSIRVSSLELIDNDLARFLLEKDPSERVDIVRGGLKIGLTAIQDYLSVAKTDYVKREFENWWNKVEGSLKESFGKEGALEHSLELYLGDEGRLPKELAKHFDPNQANSIGHQFKTIVERHISGDGSKLMELLNPTNDKSPLKKLQDQWQKDIRELRDLFKKAEGQAEEAEKGTQKGKVYEELVFEYLEEIAAKYGDEAEFVGNKEGIPGNKKGDILVAINPKEIHGKNLQIVLEAKNTSKSLNKIKNEIEEAMENRDAAVGIAVFSHAEKMPVIKRSKAGPFRHYGGMLMCVFDPSERESLALEVAYQVARIEALSSLSSVTGSVDTEGARKLIDDATSMLDDLDSAKNEVKKIIKSASKTDGLISGAAEEIRELLDEASGLLITKDPGVEG